MEVFHGLNQNDPRLRELFRTSDVFVLPSRSETFGIAAVEAGAAGLPVVVSAVGGLEDLVDDGVTGFAVPPGDANQLALALQRFVDEPALRARMGAAARQRAEREFDARRNADRLVRLAMSCLDGDAAPSVIGARQRHRRVHEPPFHDEVEDEGDQQTGRHGDEEQHDELRRHAQRVAVEPRDRHERHDRVVDEVQAVGEDPDGPHGTGGEEPAGRLRRRAVRSRLDIATNPVIVARPTVTWQSMVSRSTDGSTEVAAVTRGTATTSATVSVRHGIRWRHRSRCPWVPSAAAAMPRANSPSIHGAANPAPSAQGTRATPNATAAVAASPQRRHTGSSRRAKTK